MKNKEKYAKEIIEIACDCCTLAVNKNTGKPEKCSALDCDKCLLTRADGSCNAYKKAREWAESEYIEKLVISKKDRAFLEYLGGKIRYMARDMSGRLYIYIGKPYKQIDCWSSSASEIEKPMLMFKIGFPMVKWSDSEPWLIEDLKKLEAVEEYE